MLASASAVKCHNVAPASDALPFVSMSASSAGDVSTIGGRIRIALGLEGSSQNKVETEMIRRGYWNSRGGMSSLISGRRGKTQPDPRTIAAIADILHVQFEWLLLGIGSMRRDGRVEGTSFEQAMVFARQANCREDAIQNVWTHNKTRDDWTVFEWIAAINAEALALNARKVPRPEEVVDEQAAIRRQKKKIGRASEQTPAPAAAHPRKRLASGAP
jgi:transcriptional regulator with XRE-family HTH domain